MCEMNTLRIGAIASRLVAIATKAEAIASRLFDGATLPGQ